LGNSVTGGECVIHERKNKYLKFWLEYMKEIGLGYTWAYGIEVEIKKVWREAVV
jgi:hypothetical protein